MRCPNCRQGQVFESTATVSELSCKRCSHVVRVTVEPTNSFSPLPPPRRLSDMTPQAQRAEAALRALLHHAHLYHVRAKADPPLPDAVINDTVSKLAACGVRLTHALGYNREVDGRGVDPGDPQNACKCVFCAPYN